MANRLASATSPYLRQHAANPVDWYPWGPEAFERARLEDKPLLISIGYSACHWCHVMAHESFEDPGTAQLMNELFVNVKVDREERPDVDSIYMEATQALTGSGGWPMTVFATPGGEPFFCGTYFPPRSTHGRPGFAELCRAVADAWRNRRDELLHQAGRLTDHLRGSAVRTDGELPSPSDLAAAFAKLREGVDARWGGFGGPPKFPQASNLDLLLAAAATTGDRAALAAACTTLDAMAAGGIHDHLGGGFARYSVDHMWLVPHFEKMLYDQAQLVRVYLHAWQLTGSPAYRQVVEDTVAYVLRDLRDPRGGFYSAEDADSEGVEGKFYLWTPEQIREALAQAGHAALAERAASWWGVSEEGNFEGASILNLIAHRDELLRPADIEVARSVLMAAREQRVRPSLDDKVLAEWNGLMLGSLAVAGAVLQRSEWVSAAVSCADFLCAELRDGQGRLLRSWQGSADPPARQLGFAADHAALVDGLVRLFEATGDPRWIFEARATADSLLDRFWDGAAGGVFTTPDDGEQLVARPKDLMDNATPSANSLAALGLLRLGAVTGEERYGEAAEAIIGLLGSVALDVPGAFGNLLAAAALAGGQLVEVVVAGDRPDLVAEVRRRWLPQSVLVWGQPFNSPLWAGRVQGDGDRGGRAYVCRGSVCDAPAADVATLGSQLDALARH